MDMEMDMETKKRGERQEQGGEKRREKNPERTRRKRGRAAKEKGQKDANKDADSSRNQKGGSEGGAFNTYNKGVEGPDDPNSTSQKKDAGMRLIVCEDNEAVIKIVSKQRSMALRHVSRTHRVCLDWTFEIMKNDSVSMRYVNTKYQIADMMTKAFTKKDAWQYLLDLSAII